MAKEAVVFTVDEKRLLSLAVEHYKNFMRMRKARMPEFAEVAARHVDAIAALEKKVSDL